MIVLVTDISIFVLKSDNFAIINHVNLKQLNRILSIRDNSSLFVLNFKDSVDLLLESITRTEFILFLMNNAEINRRDRP